MMTYLLGKKWRHSNDSEVAKEEPARNKSWYMGYVSVWNDWTRPPSWSQGV